jgi:hypothetical protein
MKVYELLATPDKWTKGHLATDDMGDSVGEYSPSACRWCLIGAVFKCYGNFAERDPIVAAINRKTGPFPSQWNDAPERTHAEVLALCKELDI